MERIEVKGWCAKDGNSELSILLSDTTWNFTQYDGVKDNEERMRYIKEYAEGLQRVLAAMGVLGEIEHTSDWDPLLVITLRNGEQVESASHYYQIDGVSVKSVFIEAPPRKDYKNWEEEEPEKYYIDLEDGLDPQLVIPLAAIALIEIDTQ